MPVLPQLFCYPPTCNGYSKELRMAVVVDDIVRITAKLELDGTFDIVNVFHFTVDVNLTPDDTVFMSDVAFILDTLYALQNNRMSDRITYDVIEGVNVTQSVLLPQANWPVLVVGLAIEEMLPETVAASVFHRTATPRVRATKFMPPTTEFSSTGGALETVYAGLMQNFANALAAPLLAAQVTLSYGAFNRVLSTFTPVTLGVVPARFRTQRRRRIGVGS